MNVIAADIGNSATKIAVGTSDDLECPIGQTVCHGDQPINIELSKESAFWSICTVNPARAGILRKWIAQNRADDYVYEIRASDVSVDPGPDHRETTGRDRLVAAHAAVRLAGSDRPTIVVDAGTAVTIDLVDANCQFQGGIIFPGATTNLRALSAAAPALPDLSESHRHIGIGRIMNELIAANTEMAILRGVYHSQAAAMTQIVSLMSAGQQTACPVFATGGGVERLQDFLPSKWNFVPNLVLQGAFDIGKRRAKSGMGAGQ